jgi:hypothetical protein
MRLPVGDGSPDGPNDGEDEQDDVNSVHGFAPYSRGFRSSQKAQAKNMIALQAPDRTCDPGNGAGRHLVSDR